VTGSGVAVLVTGLAAGGVWYAGYPSAAWVAVAAAALLMPAALVRHHYEECGGDFERLCAVFGSSGAAMGRRLHAVI
jgi:hypothetical protein